MPGSVLLSNDRRIREATGGNTVAYKPKDIEDGKVDVEAQG